MNNRFNTSLAYFYDCYSNGNTENHMNRSTEIQSLSFFGELLSRSRENMKNYKVYTATFFQY